MATDVVISGVGFRDIYFRYSRLPEHSGLQRISFYLQYMGVAVVISFIRAPETEIPPRWLPTGVKKGGI